MSRTHYHPPSENGIGVNSAAKLVIIFHIGNFFIKKNEFYLYFLNFGDCGRKNTHKLA